MLFAISIYIHPNDIGAIASFYLLFFIFTLYVCFDFLILEFLFKEKIINSSNYSNLSYGRELKSEINLSNRIGKKSIQHIFLSNPAYFFSLVSLFLLAIFFILIQSNYYYAINIIDIFIINELVSIPILFIYELLNEKSTRFDFLAFFLSYIAKYIFFILLVLFIVGSVSIFGLSYSLADLIGAFFLLILPFFITMLIYFSNYGLRLENILNIKPNRNNKLVYCLVEGTIIFSMFFILLFYSNSPFSIIIIISSSIIIMGTLVVHDFYTMNNFPKNQKFRNAFDV